MQEDLFAAPLVPGFRLVEDAVTPSEETGIAVQIDAAPLQPFQFGQWEGKRLTASYGSAYDFTRHAVVPAPPFPGWLEDLRSRLAALAGLDAGAIAQALLIRYDPGAGIGWHRDRPQYEDVLGLSLSAPATLRLRRRTETGFQRHKVFLPQRSLYRLSGEVRREWEHSILPMEVTRRSLTLRTMRS
ncbi:alpha-ketoglutarate-dependent dioxygenase AlkB [Altericroceibacterium xinjiangense]|uniref:alpha-ketoglutarate-dependent dioxygenase AlkB n=1 Tax=Altericroceibacterium xinjiangense TaxID=762261 RepID=UPI000F7F57EF|nr:alpha-ketoglutarate-dependent dioxygenase AlkB [Altericroceibacterium xinjiangense]